MPTIFVYVSEWRASDGLAPPPGWVPRIEQPPRLDDKAAACIMFGRPMLSAATRVLPMDVVARPGGRIRAAAPRRRRRCVRRGGVAAFRRRGVADVFVAAASPTRPSRPSQDCWLDGMDRALEDAYEARPWRVYVLDAATKRVAFATGPGPVNGIAKARALDAFLDEAARRDGG